jgi:hypothetical protein
MRTTISVSSSPDLLKLGAKFEGRKNRLLDEAAAGMTVEVAKRAPGGPGGKIGRSFHSIGPSVVSAHPGAKALEYGAFVQAKRRQTRTGRPAAIRFQGSSGPVYRRFVRIPAKHYVRKALGKRRAVIDAAVRKVYADVLD